MITLNYTHLKVGRLLPPPQTQEERRGRDAGWFCTPLDLSAEMEKELAGG